MEISIRTPAEWLREIEVQIEAEQLKSRLDSLLNEYQEKAALPGFRRGKVPRHILERRLGNALEATVVEELVEKTLEEVLSTNNIKPASRAKIDNLKIEDDKSIRFKALVEVIPDFELQDYNGIPLRREVPSGFDAEFEKRFNALREKCAIFQPVLRPARNGDFVSIDYVLKEKDRVIAGPKNNISIQVGAENNHPAINQALLGAVIGEERTGTIEFPPDHPDKNLAGKTVVYHLKVRGIKEKKLPEVNDEFAQDLGYENLDALRQSLNEEILAEWDKQVKDGLYQQIIDQLTSRHQFNPPRSWVEMHIAHLLQEFKLPDTPETREKLLPAAEKTARLDCIILRIAQRENITVSDEEIANKIQSLAEETGKKAAEIAPLIDNSSYRFYLLKNKVLDLILERANVR